MSVNLEAREIVDAAARLGIQIVDDEVEPYRLAASQQLGKFVAFVSDGSPGLRISKGDRGSRRGGRKPTNADDPYNAWAWLCDVRLADRDGILLGMDIGFKDHISVAGIPQTFGSSAMEGYIPDTDATIVTKVLEAGGRIVGKNSMSGFMGDLPVAINPLDATRITEGSSSGSAVAVAAGQVDVSFGGDQGGSIRVPSAFCGVAGMKPTFGLISHFGCAFGSEPSVDHVGPIARRVEDLARGLDAVAGPDGRDPRQGSDVPKEFSSLRTLDRGVSGIRIGVLDEGFDEPIECAVREGVSAAVDLLRGEGASVHFVSVPEHRLIDDVYAALTLEGALATIQTGFFGFGSKTTYPTSNICALRHLWATHANEWPAWGKLNHIVAAISTERLRGAVYAKAHNLRPAIVNAYDKVLSRVDVIALPTVRQIAPAITPPSSDNADALSQSLELAAWAYGPINYNTKPFNYTGHPALSVPCGTSAGMPIGLQLVGRFFQDDVLLRVANVLEMRLGNKPPRY